jgi:5-methylcytosine-specific restriction enzyme subunit McrC
MRFQRNNRSYRMLMNICYFIVDCSLLTTESGNLRMPTFTDEHMSRLFERFVLNYYKRHYPSLKANADAIKWNIVDGGESEGLDLLPSMQSDITLHGAEHTLIIDTKYYSAMMQSQYDKRSIHSGNLYQIFTYVKNRDMEHRGNVSGLLLYAQTDEDIVPKVDTTIDGNRIMVRSLNLNQDFSAIEQQLRDVVVNVFKCL